MHTQTLRTVLTYIAVALIMVALGALAGWYFYLRSQGITLSELREGRGLATHTPSFNAPTGSTYQNIVSQTVARVTGFVERARSEPSRGKLWRVEQTPVAGMGFVHLGTTTLLYAQRATGHVFAADLGTRHTERRTSTLSPKTYAAHFAYDGSFVLQGIGDDGLVHSRVFAPASAASSTASTTEQVGRTLPPNIRALTLDPETRRLAWIAVDAEHRLGIMVAPWKSLEPIRLVETPLGSWRLFTPGQDRVVAALAPEDGVPSYVYDVGPQRELTPLLRDAVGASALPGPIRGSLLFSTSDGSAVELYVRAAGTSSPTLLPIKTIAEKCVWLPGNTQQAYCAVPETLPVPFFGPWYRGEVHTTDTWWMIDAVAGTAREAYSMRKADDVSIDVLRPIADPQGDYIAFIDGKTSALWTLRLH